MSEILIPKGTLLVSSQNAKGILSNYNHKLDNSLYETNKDILLLYDKRGKLTTFPLISVIIVAGKDKINLLNITLEISINNLSFFKGSVDNYITGCFFFYKYNLKMYPKFADKQPISDYSYEELYSRTDLKVNYPKNTTYSISIPSGTKFRLSIEGADYIRNNHPKYNKLISAIFTVLESINIKVDIIKGVVSTDCYIYELFTNESGIACITSSELFKFMRFNVSKEGNNFDIMSLGYHLNNSSIDDIKLLNINIKKISNDNSIVDLSGNIVSESSVSLDNNKSSLTLVLELDYEDDEILLQPSKMTSIN